MVLVRMTWSLILLAVVLLSGEAAAEKKPIRLAVMDFTPAATSSELAPLGAGLQSMITTDLGLVPALVLVERARLKDIEAELKLADSGLVDSTTAARIGGLAGASHLLVGSFTVVGGKMRIDARLFAVASGEVMLGEKMEGAESAFFELEQALVKKIIESVGVRLSRKEKAELLKPETQDYEAFQKFSQGLVLWDQKKHKDAIVAMQAAVAKDPSFSLAAQRLQQFLASAPPPAPPEVKAPEVSCKQNPLTTPSCDSPAGAGAASSESPRAPSAFVGDGKKPYSIVVRSGTDQAACITPCQLYLPKGPVEVEVLSPVRYKQTLEAPGGPAAVEISRLNKTNIIIGAVLGGLTLAMVGATVGLHEASPSATSSSNPQLYWPVTLSLATGMTFPAIYYLLQIGKNRAKVVAR